MIIKEKLSKSEALRIYVNLSFDMREISHDLLEDDDKENLKETLEFFIENYTDNKNILKNDTEQQIEKVLFLIEIYLTGKTIDSPNYFYGLNSEI